MKTIALAAGLSAATTLTRLAQERGAAPSEPLPRLAGELGLTAPGVARHNRRLLRDDDRPKRLLKTRV